MVFLSGRKSIFLSGLLLGLTAFAGAQAPQDTIFHLAPQPAFFTPYSKIDMRLGDGFTALNDSQHIVVRLIGKDAANVGSLYFINPKTGARQFLFMNTDTRDTTVDLGVFPKGSPIVFDYVVDGCDCHRFTGQNQAGTYNFDADAKLKGLAINHKAMPVSSFTNDYGDYRWAIAGRYNATSVLFGFEDAVGGDYDYNDIVFMVSGVSLDTEIKLGSPVVSGTNPFRDKSTVTVTLPPGAPAGELIFYTTDGTAPQVDSLGHPVPGTTTTPYAGPFDVTKTTTVTAIAWRANGKDSTGATVKYQASAPTVIVFTSQSKLDTPVATPPGGTTWTSGLSITLTQAQGGEIHYVLCDPKAACADPTQNSAVYSGPVALTRPSVLKAVAFKPGFVESDVLTAVYTLSLQVVSAYYLDENGDGHIDAAKVVLGGKTTVVPDQLVLDDPFHPGTSVTLSKSQITIDPNDASVLIARFPDQPFEFGTAFPEKDYGHIPAGSDAFPAENFVVSDSVGPVLVSAEATPPTASSPAKLKVTFSEDVNVDVTSKDFPFDIKRLTGADPNGKIEVAQIDKLDGHTVEYVLVQGSQRYPVAGDSLKLLPSPSVRDLGGQESHMGVYIPIKGAPGQLHVDIGAVAGDTVHGEPLSSPRPLLVPISVVYVDTVTRSAPVCLDCQTGEWKSQDPNRPDVFPPGPKILITTKGPFTFDLAFFDNLGTFVNRAKGTVTRAMLGGIKPDKAGNKVVALMWYPVSNKGNQVGTGAYIVKGSYTTLAGTDTGSQGEVVNLSPMTGSITAVFGYIR